ncbi:protein ImuA [Sphingomonas sp. MAH-20]|uniref:Protein ImuA n=1 Tax=Sphingomonas horti TaxID=2682842 RepID=A0A6I4IY34_9SPHN|nr:protein ImuA [Sphingomonas horti]MBA2921052.1 protein ImuA [Sphingomonas sp. CGMCC 1.13658]MVO76996.1 protein ImuA [Sphingomonas horti]
MTGCSARTQCLESLRAQVARVAAVTRTADALPFGLAALDERLQDHGLSRGALHDLAPAAPCLADDAATTLFTAGVVARLAQQGGSVLWAVSRFDLYGPGLEQAGLAPDRVIFVEARDDTMVLAAMEDALRHGTLAAVVGEVRRAGMTATRRLQLAAAETGTPALLFRRWRKAGQCPLAEPSAAVTRWRVGCAPSLPGAAGLTRARWSVELARQRGGDPFSIIVEACDAQGRLALPAAAVDRAAAPERAAARAA